MIPQVEDPDQLASPVMNKRAPMKMKTPGMGTMMGAPKYKGVPSMGKIEAKPSPYEVPAMAKGGSISKRADGIAQRGKTKGRMV